MLNNLKPFYNSTNICLENIYVSMCNALKRDFINMYAYSWNFGYKSLSESNDSELFGKRITPGRDGQGINSDQFYALEKYCGICPVWHMNGEYKNFVNIVKHELANNRPIVIGTDVFYCHWHKLSSRYHSIHYCLIIGMNDDGLICIDDTLAGTGADGYLLLPDPPENIILDFDTFKKFNFGFITFKINPYVPKYSNDEIIYLSALKTLTGFDGKSDYQNMMELLTDINKSFDIVREIQGFADIWASDLVRRFTYFVWGRNNYIMFLEKKQKYLGKDLQAIIHKMSCSLDLWNRIKNHIVKYANESNVKFNKEIICDHLRDIIKIEETLANAIVNVYY